MKAERLRTVLSVLAGVTNLSAKEGEPEQAVEFLALVLHHSASAQVMKDRAHDLLSELGSEVPPEVVADATARGQARGLEDVAAEILGRNAAG